MRAPSLIAGLSLQDQRAMTPRRQRGIDQFALGKQSGEINAGTGGEEITHQRPQSVRHLLATTHGGNGGHRDVQCGRGLIDGTNQQRVRREFGENPEAVFERGLGRSREPDRVAKVVNPVVDIAVRLLARVEKGCGVERNLRSQRGDVIEHAGKLFEDRLDLRGMRCDIDRHLARHDLALLPLGDDAAHRFRRATDHRGGRGGHYGDDDVLHALLFQLLPHHLSGQFDRGHGAAAGDLQTQQRPTTDHLDAIGQRQSARDDSGGDLAQRVADDRTGRYSVGRHSGGHRDLHRKDRGLDPVNAGHRLRCQHRLGDRETGLGGNQRLEFGDRGSEHRFGGQQAGAHRRPLRPLSGEHPHRPAVILADCRLERIVTVGDRQQALHQNATAVSSHGRAYRPVAAATRQGIRQVTQNQIIAGSLDPVSKAL